MKIVIIGGGAAGFFAAITAAQTHPQAEILLIEKSRALLSKVRISGGGRCNVTHACFDPAQLVQNYPRGSKELRGPFARFQPRNTIEWFEKRGVPLKTEKDGRMFPTTDSSQTIIDCLIRQAKNAGVTIAVETCITAIQKNATHFVLQIADKPAIECDRVLLATGGNRTPFSWLQELGHTIQPLVPSLFTFNIANFALKELAGISVKKATVKIAKTTLEQTGPLLITHWGFSGPAVLKLSSFGARLLHDMAYKAECCINWIPDVTTDEARTVLEQLRSSQPRKALSTLALFDLPSNLWKALIAKEGIDGSERLADISNKKILSFIERLRRDSFQIDGQTTHKEEFVTCGGVSLDEVQFKTMESKIVPGLFFAGEILDIDGVTGGFNFQNAWTTGWIAGHAINDTNDKRP
ncbi:MAG: NAD(P)/FAD-dependent oxidoreductase [Verrucomicrobia bacterium]|nr:NAD(P)/FAD-dependent oxidoreductase [Verrucomicrobiota bacterium]